MALRFVRPETLTLSLSDGDSMTIRKRLTAGERRAMYGRMYRPGTTSVDPMRVYLANLTAYLLDWTAVDDAGNKVNISDATTADLETILNALEPESFAELVTTLEAYTDGVAADADEKKTIPAGAPAS